MTAKSSTKPSDEAVSRLPIERGRAELLEEILGASSAERPAPPTTVSTLSSRRWLVPAAAAAVVAGLAVTSAVTHGGAGPTSNRTAGAVSPSAQDVVSEKGERVLTDAPGWQVQSAGSDGDVYSDGPATLEITRYPAGVYADYVEDREYIVDPPAPGVAVTVLGVPGQMWAYAADDHTVIRQVVDGQWMELRGQGLDEQAFRSLLGSLRLVSTAAFEQALPPRDITAEERDAAVDRILDQITDQTAMVPGALNAGGEALPEGHTLRISSTEEDPYQLGAAVAGAYACTWLADYESATAAGDAAEASVAVQVLGTSRNWPVLQQMNPEGDYPEAIWQYADEIAAGRQPNGYQSGLGC